MAAMPGIVAAAVLQKSDDSELKDTAACEGPDFDKDEHPTVQSHHIEFPESTPPVAGDNPQSLASQVPSGNPLAPPA